MKILTVLILNLMFLLGSELKDSQIGNMFMVGFYGTSAPKNSKICKDIKKYNLAGVIIFDYNPIKAGRAKNIVSTKQLKRLTDELQECSPNITY